MSASEESLALLRSMDATLKNILAVMGKERSHPPVSASAPNVDLDGQHGDPIVKAKSPRDWSGPVQAGKRFSQCPPEYLLMVADRLDYFTSQLGGSDEDKKKARYNALDAARARGWAARLRASGVATAAPVAPPDDEGYGSIPF